MQDVETIARATIAQLSQIDINKVTNHESLKQFGFKNSISLLKLQSALEKKLSRKLKPLSEDVTLNQILQNNEGEGQSKVVASSENVSPVTLANTQSLQSGFQIGVDIESVTQFPESDDFRNHEFYSSLFTAREISQAILTNDPRHHLCIVFAAKEAFKKSSAHWLNMRMQDISVQLDVRGNAEIFLVQNGSEENVRSIKVSTSFAHPFAIAVVVSTTPSV